MMSSQSVIYLIGDGILDNFNNLENKEQDLTYELTNLGHKVFNYAVDETKVLNVIKGINVNPINTVKRPYLHLTNNKLYQLELLGKHTNVNKSFKSVYGDINIYRENNIVVLSVGGNNLRVNLFSLLGGTKNFVSSILSKEFISNYEKIIETVLQSCSKIILISLYLPFLGKNSSYGKYSQFSRPIMEEWNNFLFKIGRKYNIPVLDLNRTVNPDNRSHYSTVDTFLSNLSNKCLADSIHYIQSHYDGHKIYYAPDCNISNITIIT